jgi:hypothetical protein
MTLPTQETTTLADSLLSELSRCQELLTQYAAIGPAGLVGAMFIKQDIAAANKAMIEGDPVGMIRAHAKLQGCK